MGKAAAACRVYEDTGQGSFEEGAWRDRGPCGHRQQRLSISRTRAGDELNETRHVFVLIPSFINKPLLFGGGIDVLDQKIGK
jgi:hypothetical protein